MMLFSTLLLRRSVGAWPALARSPHRGIAFVLQSVRREQVSTRTIRGHARQRGGTCRESKASPAVAGSVAHRSCLPGLKPRRVVFFWNVHERRRVDPPRRQTPHEVPQVVLAELHDSIVVLPSCLSILLRQKLRTNNIRIGAARLGSSRQFLRRTSVGTPIDNSSAMSLPIAKSDLPPSFGRRP